jgi:5-methylcytosine-specific restriction endonuclease McrA
MTMPAPTRLRAALPYGLQVRVFRRDGWLCRWCHRPVVFAPALKLLEALARAQGHEEPLAYHHPRWRRDRAPLLDHLGAVIDHVEALSRGGAHEEANFVTACNKCNARKNDSAVHAFKAAVPASPVKGKYGEPVHWDGFSTLFVLFARDATDLTATERKWLAALTA